MSNEFDAFSEGIEPGGLRNRTQIKVLITYMVNRLNSPLTREMLIQALQLHGLANYFEASQAMDELVENGSLYDDKGFIALSPKGELSVGELSGELPVSVKETALADAMNLQLLEKRESENTVDIKNTEDGCYVTFKVAHNGEILMELTVYAADTEQAQRLKHNFLKDPSHVYSTVAASLFI